VIHACISTPSIDGRVGVAYHFSKLRQLAKAHEHGIMWSFGVDCFNSLLPFARGTIMGDFLENPESGDVLVMIDSDMGWKEDDLARMVKHAADGVPFLGAAGRSRHDGRWCFRFLPGEDALTAKRDERGLVSVGEIGGAFLVFRRKTLERMAEAFHHLGGTRAGGVWCPGAFLPQAFDGELYGEDFVFSRRWRTLGGEVLLDPETWLSHDARSEPFSGRAAELFE